MAPAAEERLEKIEARLDAQAERLEWITGIIKTVRKWGFVSLGVLFVNGNIDHGIISAIVDRVTAGF